MDWKLVKNGVYKKTGRRGVRYRVRVTINGTLKSKVYDAKSDADALKQSKFVIAELIGHVEPSNVTWESLRDELLTQYESKRPATYALFESITRVHLLPFFAEHSPRVLDENPEVLWLKYASQKKGKLFNHRKYFMKLCRYAYQKGLLLRQPQLEWGSFKHAQAPAKGQVLSSIHSLLECADDFWRDRIILGWHTGMRPGEIRSLQKSRVDFKRGTIKLLPEDTKTKQAREFAVNDEVLSVLRRRFLASQGDYFFPDAKDPSKPVGPQMGSWRRIVANAGLEGLTPHDLRHSYVTRMLKTSIPPLVLCHAVGMSLQEMQKTYLHLTAEDTRVLLDA
jgi:integrase